MFGLFKIVAPWRWRTDPENAPTNFPVDVYAEEWGDSGSMIGVREAHQDGSFSFRVLDGGIGMEDVDPFWGVPLQKITHWRPRPITPGQKSAT